MSEYNFKEKKMFKKPVRNICSGFYKFYKRS